MKTMRSVKIFLISGGALFLAGASSAASITLPQVTYSKVTVTFDQPTFTVSYGQTINLCATVKPARLASKLAWTSSPTGALIVTPGTDPSCNAGNGVYLTVQSSIQTCVTQASVQATINTKVINSASATIQTPTGDFAVLVSSGNCLPVGCFFKDYNVFMTGPQGLNLSGLSASENVTNRRQIGSTPACPFNLQQTIGGIPLEQGTNGLFGVGDQLQIPGGSISGSCADQYDQIVTIGACPVQTNTLTYQADSFGDRSITRSDEQ